MDLARIKRIAYTLLILWMIGLGLLMQLELVQKDLASLLVPAYFLLLLGVISADIDLTETPAYGTVDDPLIRQGAVFIVAVLAWILPFIIPMDSLALSYIIVGFILMIFSMGTLQLVDIGIHLKVHGLLKTLPFVFYSIIYGPLMLMAPFIVFGIITAALFGTLCVASSFINPGQLGSCLSITLLSLAPTLPLGISLVSYLLTRKDHIKKIEYHLKRRTIEVITEFQHTCLESRIHQFLQTITLRVILDFILLGFLFLGLFVKLGGALATIAFTIILWLSSISSSRKQKTVI